MDKSLFWQAITKVSIGIVLVALLLFLPAWTLDYWQAWLLLGVLFVPMIAAGFVLMAKNPALLRKRLHTKESEQEQRTVILLSGIMFLAAFVLAGLSRRFGFLMLPGWVSIAAAVLFLAAYALYAEVLRENEYLSRTIEVQQGQKVIDTGLYGVVRHPMYLATVLLFLAMPLVLGSALSVFVMLAYIPIIAARIKNEEQVLERGLAGYAEYKQRVKYRLIPYIW